MLSDIFFFSLQNSFFNSKLLLYILLLSASNWLLKSWAVGSWLPSI
uniref:Drought responsive protein n=1 Tax=Arachis hypogaea TaxID=3818 RepID=Q56G51_ARAHY|nr:drought responsive protein [Arachis hypogaea]